MISMTHNSNGAVTASKNLCAPTPRPAGLSIQDTLCGAPNFEYDGQAYVLVPAAASGPSSASKTSDASVSSEEQLRSLKAAMTSVPGGTAAGSQKRRSHAKLTPLAKDGQIVSRFYPITGARPYPTNGISLEQGITIELTVNIGSFISSSATAGTSTFAGRPFTVSDFSAATALLNVFDQYRIDQLEAWLEPTAPNGSSAFPIVYTAVDLDDANTPTSVGQVADKQGAETGSGYSGRYHRWKPHVAVALYSGAFTSYGNQKSTWIDSASPNVQHFGLKTATTSTSSGIVSYFLTVRAVVSFRAPALN